MPIRTLAIIEMTENKFSNESFSDIFICFSKSQIVLTIYKEKEANSLKSPEFGSSVNLQIDDVTGMYLNL